MTRLRRIAFFGVALVVVFGVSWGVLGSERAPEGIIIGESVAPDLASLAQTTFGEFAAATPGTANCIGQPTLEAAPGLDDLATYDQDTATIRVRVPATAPSLEASLVHELAHHIEVACPTHLELRPRFLDAQGHSADTPWFDAGAWELRPSEQFAEVVVAVVLGERRRNVLRVPLAPEAMDLVANWLTAPA